MRYILSLVLFISAFFSSANTTATPLSIEPSFSSSRSLNLYYTTEVNSLQQASNFTHWQQIKNNTLNLGTAVEYGWIKLSVTHPELTEQKLFLRLENPLLDKVTLYKVYNGKLISTRTIGDEVAIENRQYVDESLLFDLTLAHQGKYDFYLEVNTLSGFHVPVSLWSPKNYFAYKTAFNTQFGLLIGFILAIALINLILFVLAQKGYFLLSAGYALGLGLLGIYLFGFGYYFLTPNIVWLQQILLPSLFIFTTVMTVQFNSIIIGLKNRAGHLFNLHKLALMFSALAILLVLFIPTTYAITLGFVVALLLLILSSVFIALSVKNVLRLSLLLLTNAGFLIPLVYMFASYMGAFSQVTHINILLIIPPSISAILCIYLAIKHYVLARDEKVKNQQKELDQHLASDALLAQKLAIEEEAKADLEAKIDERTFELQITLQELEEKNRALEARNNEDPLTGVKNRRYFDKKLTMELRRSKREQTEFSLLMIDIDHFKQVNDRYGHLAGDAALKHVAAVFNQLLRRPADEACRYGGEEFAILLPNTAHQGAIQLAEKIRQHIEQHHVEFSSQQIKLTLSIGVHTSIIDDANSADSVTDAADKALYHAKKNGRNQVVSTHKINL